MRIRLRKYFYVIVEPNGHDFFFHFIQSAQFGTTLFHDYDLSLRHILRRHNTVRRKDKILGFALHAISLSLIRSHCSSIYYQRIVYVRMYIFFLITFPFS